MVGLLYLLGCDLRLCSTAPDVTSQRRRAQGGGKRTICGGAHSSPSLLTLSRVSPSLSELACDDHPQAGVGRTGLSSCAPTRFGGGSVCVAADTTDRSGFAMAGGWPGTAAARFGASTRRGGTMRNRCRGDAASPRTSSGSVGGRGKGARMRSTAACRLRGPRGCRPTAVSHNHASSPIVSTSPKSHTCTSAQAPPRRLGESTRRRERPRCSGAGAPPPKPAPARLRRGPVAEEPAEGGWAVRDRWATASVKEPAGLDSDGISRSIAVAWSTASIASSSPPETPALLSGPSPDSRSSPGAGAGSVCSGGSSPSGGDAVGGEERAGETGGDKKDSEPLGKGGGGGVAGGRGLRDAEIFGRAVCRAGRARAAACTRFPRGGGALGFSFGRRDAPVDGGPTARAELSESTSESLSDSSVTCSLVLPSHVAAVASAGAGGAGGPGR